MNGRNKTKWMGLRRVPEAGDTAKKEINLQKHERL